MPRAYPAEFRDDVVRVARNRPDGVTLEKAPDLTGLVLNLAAVNFLDSTGIGALVELAGQAEDAGVAFVLQDPSERVTRVLTISGLLDTWPIESSTDQA